MAITINGSGTITGVSAGGLPDGSVTADDLATSLDLTGKTVTLPSGTGGKILQVVNETLDTQTNIATSDYSDLGLSASITPSSTSSKILIFVSIQSYLSTARGYGLKILRDSTAVYTAGNNYEIYVSNTGGGFRNNWIDYDSPATTSATTYKLQVKPYAGNEVNFSESGDRCSLVLVEVGA